MKKVETNQKIIALNNETTEEYEFLIQKENKFISNDKEIRISTEQTSDGFMLATINGVSYPVEILSCKQNQYEIMVNGICYNISLESPFSLERKKILAKQSNDSSVIRIKSPMPGKIIDVLVKTGDTVKSGDTLLILEAMKMQNAILSSSKAIVKKVIVKVGDTTSKSDLLIELEKE